MRYIFALLLLSSTVVAQEWDFELASTPSWDFTVVDSEPVKLSESTYSVTMFSASWCGPCRSSKVTTVPKLEKALGTKVSVVDVDADPQWKKPKRIRFVSGSVDHSGIRSVPVFWLIETVNGKSSVVKEWKGAVTADTILSEVPKQAQIKVETVVEETTTVQEYNPYNGKRGSSHQNRSTLISHLASEGIHAGRHSLKKLNSMTDVELDKLHTQDHND